MRLIDGGMHGTLDATWAGNIQRAEWPARNNRSTSSGLESHYFDFYVEVPSASGEAVYLGYVSYHDYELRVFNDKYEIWLRGGGSALGTYPAATAGRRPRLGTAHQGRCPRTCATLSPAAKSASELRSSAMICPGVSLALHDSPFRLQSRSGLS